MKNQLVKIVAGVALAGALSVGMAATALADEIGRAHV